METHPCHWRVEKVLGSAWESLRVREGVSCCRAAQLLFDTLCSIFLTHLPKKQALINVKRVCPQRTCHPFLYFLVPFPDFTLFGVHFLWESDCTSREAHIKEEEWVDSENFLGNQCWKELEKSYSQSPSLLTRRSFSLQSSLKTWAVYQAN